MKKELNQKIQLLPSKPGVYFFKNTSGQILYIGKAINLKNRVKSHFKKNDSLIGQFRQKISTIDYIKTENETQALILEDQLIKKYQPKFNIQQKDDKSYFWVNFTPLERQGNSIQNKKTSKDGSKNNFLTGLTNDEWPRVQIVHRLKNRGKTNNPIGPFVNGTELKKTLRALRKILPYRTCKNSYEKPCLQWHLGLCPAHSGKGQIADSKSLQNPPQPSLKGGGHESCSPPLGGVRGDLKTYYQSLNSLRQILRLYTNESIRIEAYDISNIQGTNATGSMIVFNGNKPQKSDYRKFKIKTVRGANDTAMIKEVLRRRLNHKEWPLPSLMLIDGGQAQLNSAALEIGHWDLKIPLFSLAKKEDELYTIYSNKTLRLSALPISLRLSFQAIRDEAHRFAISYYRKLHQKKLGLSYERHKR